VIFSAPPPDSMHVGVKGVNSSARSRVRVARQLAVAVGFDPGALSGVRIVLGLRPVSRLGVSAVVTEPTATPGFSVLVICTANHCRSPMIEYLLRARTRRLGLNWSLHSAGTQAQPGLPMHPLAAREVTDRGMEVGDWSSTSLIPAMIEEADLVLTAGHEHRSAAVRLVPAALHYSFTLLQFADLLATPSGPGHTQRPITGPLLLERVARGRTLLQPVPPQAQALEDPMGRSRRRFRLCAAKIDQALDVILG